MRRNFLLGLMICLIPTAIAGLYTGLAFYKESRGETGFRRGIDLAGGTILVYEVNTERNQSKAQQPGGFSGDSSLDSEAIRKLAENLKRRIDPNDLKNVVVRPVGTTRVEIILPFAGSTSGSKEAANEDFVREVRELVAQVGVLEFRFLANTVDDADAIADAKRLINSDDPKVKAELERRAKAGLPPPAPTNTYTVTINNITQDNVAYEWTELGKEERDSLNLSNVFGTDALPKDSKGNPRSNQIWKLAEANREKAETGIVPGLLYSRKFQKLVPAKGEENKQFEYFILTRISPLDSMKVDREAGLGAQASNNLRPEVDFYFRNPSGANRFGKITERNRPDPTTGFKRHLAIILDDKIVSAPQLNGVLRERGTISGGSFDMPAVNKLVYILRSGALNAELKPDPVSENSVGPTLGQDTINRGLTAIVLSFVAVLIFMVYYYKFAGVIATLALFVNLLLTVGFMVMVSAAFTLPGLAGIVLMLGMAVDANVLINERIREERDKGANLITAIRLGYDRAFATIIDTHLTSIFTCLVLYTFGNDNLKGFAVSLTVGLIISLFTSLYMTRLMFDYWTYKRWMTSFTPRTLIGKPNLDFMAIRNPMFLLTAALTIAGLGLFLYRGESVLNVDFTKGTLYSGSLKEGQERALADVSNQKGFLTLLSEENQKARLKVKSVTWLTQPSGSEEPGTKAAATEYIYEIIYDDGNGAESRVTVTLANPPEGATTEAQEADLKARASGLPGVAVEQVFRAGESYPDYKSRSFTVRTTEKEPELVQAMLDRLLRDENNEPLLAATQVTDIKIEGPVATITMSQPSTTGYFRSFLLREMKLANRYPSTGQGAASAVEVTGVQAEGDAGVQEARSGRYRVFKVDVSNNPNFKALKDAFDAKKDLSADKKAAEELDAFKRILDDAKKSFQSRPIPERLETFDPGLAAETRNRAFYAILASWLAILLYLWFRFGSWTFGLAAVLCLIHDLSFTLGAIAFCHYIHDTTIGHWLMLKDFKIDLGAVAALLTLIGYSVTDTIVVFDRIREVRGKTAQLTPQMINDSVNQTLSRTILTALTVFIVSIVLYTLGGEGIHLFSFVMIMGVLVGTYSSIYIASPLLLIFGEGRVEPKEKALVPVNTPTDEIVA